MSTTYKVWIEIEAWDEDTQSGKTLVTPGVNVAAFTSFKAAERFAAKLQVAGEAFSGCNDRTNTRLTQLLKGGY
jgi:hypothetical protein